MRRPGAAGNALFQDLGAGYAMCSVSEKSVSCTLMCIFLYVCYNWIKRSKKWGGKISASLLPFPILQSYLAGKYKELEWQAVCDLPAFLGICRKGIIRCLKKDRCVMIILLGDSLNTNNEKLINHVWTIEYNINICDHEKPCSIIWYAREMLKIGFKRWKMMWCDSNNLRKNKHREKNT